jgi:hypothetical protein
VISRSSRDAGNNAADQVVTNEPSEPLAEMGVAPGASTSNGTENNTSTVAK